MIGLELNRFSVPSSRSIENFIWRFGSAPLEHFYWKFLLDDYFFYRRIRCVYRLLMPAVRVHVAMRDLDWWCGVKLFAVKPQRSPHNEQLDQWASWVANSQSILSNKLANVCPNISLPIIGCDRIRPVKIDGSSLAEACLDIVFFWLVSSLTFATNVILRLLRARKRMVTKADRAKGFLAFGDLRALGGSVHSIFMLRAS